MNCNCVLLKGKSDVKYMVQRKKKGESIIKYSKELHQLYQLPDIISKMQAARLCQAGHLQRVGN
jgi:ABC-type uncharacterized transport system ATPase subunit